jgi:hypothetical protein
MGFGFRRGPLRSCPLGVPCAEHFLSEEVLDVSRVGLGFRLNLNQTLGLRLKKSRCEPLSFFWLLDFVGPLRSCPLGVLAGILIEEDSGREASRVIFRLTT